MTTVQVVDPNQDYVHPDDQTQPTFEMIDSWVQTFHKSKYFKNLIVFNYFLVRLTFLRLYNSPLRLYEVLKLA